jgi:hypothetical protein
MLSLYNSEPFQKEYNDFKNRIDQITDLRVKSDLENLLFRLEQKVKSMDSQHVEMIISKQMKSLGSDFKDDIIELRRSIDKKLKDWDSK